MRAKEEMIEIRVRLDSGTVEPVFVTAKVLARAVQKMRDLRIDALPKVDSGIQPDPTKSRDRIDAASRETERKLRRIKRRG